MKDNHKKLALKKQLDEDLGADLDLDLAWAEFKGKKSKRRFLLWWQYLGLSILATGVLVAGFMIFSSLENKEKLVQLDTQLEIVTEISDKNLKKLQGTTVIKNEPLLKKENATTSASLAETNTTEQSNSNEQTKIEQDYVRKEQIKLDRKDNFNLNHKNLNDNFNSNSNDNLNHKNLNDNFNSNDNDNSHTRSNDSDNFVGSKPLKTIIEEAANNSLFKPKNSARFLEEVPMIPTRNALLETEDRELPPLPPIIPDLNTSFWEIGLLYQSSFSNRQLSGVDMAFAQRRSENENLLLAHQFQLPIRYTFSKRFFLQSGLMISQHTSRLVDEFQTIEPKVFDGQIVTIIRVNNQEETVVGSVAGTQTAFHTNTRYQRYQALSIPIQVGYAFPFKETFAFEVTTGVNWSIWNRQNGLVQESATSIGTYQSLDELGYKRTGILQGLSSLAATKQFGKNYKVAIGLQAQYDLSNRIQKDLGSTDKFRGWGLQIGILKKL